MTLARDLRDLCLAQRSGGCSPRLPRVAGQARADCVPLAPPGSCRCDASRYRGVPAAFLTHGSAMR